MHLVHRPEAGGGVLQQVLSGNQTKSMRLHANILTPQAKQVFSKYGTYRRSVSGRVRRRIRLIRRVRVLWLGRTSVC